MAGLSPQRGPPSATGGHLTSSCQARRSGARVRAADQNETPTPRSINIVACLQETDLKDN